MKKVLIVLVLLVAVVALVGIATPTDYDIGTSLVINATPEQVHAYVGHLEKWPEWAPWEEEDPTIVTTLGDKTTGVGASQSWTSKDGDGELTLTKCDPATGIAYEMAFIMEGERFPSTSAMTYKAVDGGTEVTWTMQGDWKGAMPPIVDAWMKIFTPMMIGGMFDQGLQNLKGLVEASA